jgi:hypothetical protein
VFKLFPGKEALVFDQDEAQDAELVVACSDPKRLPGRALLKRRH